MQLITKCILLHLDAKILKLSIRSIWSNVSFKVCVSNVSFKVCVSLLSLSSDVQSIGVNGVLKSPTIILLLLISPVMPVNVCHIY